MSFNFNFDDTFKRISSSTKKAKRAANNAKKAASNAKKTAARVKKTSRQVSNNARRTTNNIKKTRSQISNISRGSGASYSHPGSVSQPSGRLGRGGGTGNANRIHRTSADAIAARNAAAAAPKMPSEKEWLAGDSTYQDQNSEYTRALQEYIARISEREGEIKEDAKLALAANARNRTMGMNNNAEDFASRGLINSGLFANSSEKMSDRYNESQGAIETNQSRGLGTLADERSNYEREVELGRNNAKRSALQRMAAQFGTM